MRATGRPLWITRITELTAEARSGKAQEAADTASGMP